MTYNPTTIGLLIAAGKMAKARTLVEQALARHEGNVSAAARELDTSYTQLKRWMETLGVERKTCPTCRRPLEP